LEIRTAGKDVLLCGTVLTANSTDLEFRVAHLKILCTFLSDGGAPRLDASNSDASTLNLKLHNFSSAIGTGTTSPLAIGTYQGRSLLFAFTVHALSAESIKTVHYTFMLGDSA
jgi:hypothetical protein